MHVERSGGWRRVERSPGGSWSAFSRACGAPRRLVEWSGGSWSAPEARAALSWKLRFVERFGNLMKHLDALGALCKQWWWKSDRSFLMRDCGPPLAGSKKWSQITTLSSTVMYRMIFKYFVCLLGTINIHIWRRTWRIPYIADPRNGNVCISIGLAHAVCVFYWF
jgi:hypothetical protein